MSKITGRLVSLGIAKEASRGVGVAPSMWIPHTEFSLYDRVVSVRDDSGFGNLADSQDVMVAEKYAEGDIGGQVRDQSFGYFLLALLGSVDSDASGEGYAHTFALTQSNQHQSLTLVKKDAISTEMYELSVLNRLDLRVALDSLVTFTAGIMAKSGQASTATVSYSDENKFSKKHVKIKVADDVAGLTEASVLDVKTLELTVEKNVERDSAFGTVQPIDYLNKAFSVSGSISLNYEDNTFRDYMLNGSKKSLQIVLSNSDVDLGSGLRPSLTLVLPLVDFDWSPNYALEDIVSQTINFKGNYDLENNKQIISSCVLVNGKASY